MRRYVFNTPFITPLFRVVSIFILKLFRWNVVGSIPKEVKKCVVIGGPHTSNWDFPIFLMSVFVLGLNAHWMGKHTLFHFPFHSLMTWLGGIPVNRGVRDDMVAKSVEMFRLSDSLVIGMSPEGTRKATTHWHSGFWHIAQKAGVPVHLAFIDFSTKRCGIHGEFRSSGNVDDDMKRIKKFYSNFQGRHPNQFEV